MSRIDNHKYTPQQSFNECYYEVPDYQREYVWTEREVGKLLGDIHEQTDADSRTEYFIGTILVSPSAARLDLFEVIDGQQRLTTLFLLLSAIKHRFSGAAQRDQIDKLLFTSFTDEHGNVQSTLRLKPRYEGAEEAFELLINAAPGDASVRNKLKASGVNIVGSVDNLIKAYAEIGKFLSDNFADDAELRRFWGFLANKVVFIQITTDVSSALKIFETINERGIGLNPMDLLKNLLFRSVTPEAFSQLKALWTQVTAPLEAAEEKPLRYLRYFLMANYGVQNARKDGVIREDEIYDWLTAPANRTLCGYAERPFEFVRKISLNVARYLNFSKGRDVNGVDSPALARLRVMAGGAFSLHFVLLLAAAEFPDRLFAHFVEQLESFLFFYIYTKTPTKDLERSFSAWADELRGIGAIKDAEKQAKELDVFVSKYFKAAISSKTAEFIDTLRRYTLSGMQRYRTMYFLSRITQYVDMQFTGTQKAASLAPYMVLQIEHILPQSPEDELLASWKMANPTSDYDEYVDRLGNLTLLEKPINIIASNDFFSKKCVEYAKSANYLTRSIAGLIAVGKNSSITRVNKNLQAFLKWDSMAVESRQQMLIDLALEIWQTRDYEAGA